MEKSFRPYITNICKWLIALFLLLAPPPVFSQLPELTVSIDLENKSRAEALEKVSMQTGLFFTYDSELLSGTNKISLNLEDIPLESALDSILRDPALKYRLIDKNIVIFRANPVEKLKEKEERSGTLRVTGTVKDKETGNELPFATVLINETKQGVISNLHGIFSLVIHKKNSDPILVASMIGYKNSYYHVDPDKTEDIVITMEKDLVPLQEVIIRYQNPAEIIHKMLDNISDNYIDEHSSMKGYFREYVQKNKDFITFSEAVIDIAKTPYSLLRSDNVKVIKGRKLHDISQTDSVLLKIQSGVNSSLQLDVIKSRPDFLQPDFAQYYKLEFRNIVSYRNQQVYIVGFSPRQDPDYHLFRGKLYINTKDYALVAAEFSVDPENLRKNPGRFLVKKSPLIRIRPQKAAYRVEYRKKDAKYHVSMVQAKVSFRLRKKKQWFSSLYQIGIEMAITEVQPGIRTRIPRSERLKPGTILSDQEFSYDPSFWGDYNIIQPEASLQDALKKMGYEWKEFSQ